MKNRNIDLSSRIFIVIVFGLLLAVQGCWQQDSTPKFKTQYQTVVLTNGQYFFGTTEFLGKEYVRMRNIYYIYPQVDQKTKKRINVLMRKGNELHGSDEMYINVHHIMAIEPVSAGSEIGRLMIKDTQSRTVKK